MPSTNLTEEILRECPSLHDPMIICRNPDIGNVARWVFLFSQLPGGTPLFDELGIESVDEYVRLVDSRDKRVMESYNVFRGLSSLMYGEYTERTGRTEEGIDLSGYDGVPM